MTSYASICREETYDFVESGDDEGPAEENNAGMQWHCSDALAVANGIQVYNGPSVRQQKMFIIGHKFIYSIVLGLPKYF